MPIPRNGPAYLSVFSRNAGKYGPEKKSVFGHFLRSVHLKLQANSPG